jgi:threonylcarbamoyladenosine tRNA methylthiotransferase MtaB
LGLRDPQFLIGSAHLTVFREDRYNFDIEVSENNAFDQQPQPGATRVALETLGCKLNQAESESLGRQLAAAGCIMVAADQTADIYILNTCSVTHVADRKGRQMLYQARRQNPQARIIAIGCGVGPSSASPAEIKGIDLVLDNSRKNDLVSVLQEKKWLSSGPDLPPGAFQNRTRSFIRAQDGCNNFCTYCIVPLVRGSEKSLPLERVIAEVSQRVREGYREVVLTGTEIGRYRDGDAGIVELLHRLLAETEIERLRLSSLQPPEITPTLVDLWQDSRLCRHFHLSLQSGSDSVLQRMHRRYTTEQYAEKVTYLRLMVRDVSITTDVIVGFPAESQYEFQDSYDFCRRMAFSRTHVFSYSARQGTAAARMDRQVPDEIKKERSCLMLELGRQSLEKYHQRFVGAVQDVLFEQLKGGKASGYTDTYIKVYIKDSPDVANQVRSVRLRALVRDGMSGYLL